MWNNIWKQFVKSTDALRRTKITWTYSFLFTFVSLMKLLFNKMYIFWRFIYNIFQLIKILINKFDWKFRNEIFYENTRIFFKIISSSFFWNWKIGSKYYNDMWKYFWIFQIHLFNKESCWLWQDIFLTEVYPRAKNTCLFEKLMYIFLSLFKKKWFFYHWS